MLYFIFVYNIILISAFVLWKNRNKTRRIRRE